MKNNVLKNRIPPPFIMLLCIIPMVSYAGLHLFYGWVNTLLGVVFFILSATVAISSIMEFKRAKTTVNPLKFDDVQQLVVSGIFNYTRNPMYLSMLIFICGVGVYTGQYFLGGMMGIVFQLYITHFQIKPEEAFLSQEFKQPFFDYCQSVRRWL